jgi:hypothetical protein
MKTTCYSLFPDVPRPGYTITRDLGMQGSWVAGGQLLPPYSGSSAHPGEDHYLQQWFLRWGLNIIRGFKRRQGETKYYIGIIPVMSERRRAPSSLGEDGLRASKRALEDHLKQ